MKIKINQTLVGVDGIPLKSEKGIPVTFKDVAISSILNHVQNEDVQKKYKKYTLYKKLNVNKEEVDLLTEELMIVKQAIGAVQPPLIMGQCWDIIEKEN